MFTRTVPSQSNGAGKQFTVQNKQSPLPHKKNAPDFGTFNCGVGPVIWVVVEGEFFRKKVDKQYMNANFPVNKNAMFVYFRFIPEFEHGNVHAGARSRHQGPT